MATILNMPRLGLTMSEGRIVRWLKEEGEKINEGEEYVEIESDKSVAAHEAPEDGYLLKIIAQEGDTVEIYKPMGILGEKNEDISSILQDLEKTDDVEPAEKDTPSIATEKEIEKAPAQTGEQTGGRIFISPAGRRIAKENNISIADIPFPANRKRIESKDVLSYIESTKIRATPLARKIAADEGIDLHAIKTGDGQRIFAKDLRADAPQPRRIKVEGMRKVIATRMKASIDTAAHVSLTLEVDMTKVMDLRKSIIDSVMERKGVKVTINDIIVKCVSEALIEFPRINSSFTEEEVIEKEEINIGVAVALDEGLMVPVIRNADKLTIGDIAIVRKELTERAREGRLMPDDYSQGTFTVSNLGMFDITQFTSIINQPESAILSVAKIVNRPVVIEEEIVIKPMMNLTINFDHRPIDGAVAAMFLKRLKTILEEPYELLI